MNLDSRYSRGAISFIGYALQVCRLLSRVARKYLEMVHYNVNTAIFFSELGWNTAVCLDYVLELSIMTIIIIIPLTLFKY